MNIKYILVLFVAFASFGAGASEPIVGRDLQKQVNEIAFEKGYFNSKRTSLLKGDPNNFDGDGWMNESAQMAEAAEWMLDGYHDPEEED